MAVSVSLSDSRLTLKLGTRTNLSPQVESLGGRLTSVSIATATTLLYIVRCGAMMYSVVSVWNIGAHFKACQSIGLFALAMKLTVWHAFATDWKLPSNFPEATVSAGKCLLAITVCFPVLSVLITQRVMSSLVLSLLNLPE